MRGLCSWPALSRKKLIRKLFSGKTLSLCVFLNFRHLTKYFPQIYGSPYVAAMLVHFHGTPTWRPENGVSIWNLLWLSRRLIFCTEQICIYNNISTFPDTYSPPQPSEIQNMLVCGRSKLLSWKVVNRYKFTPSNAWWGYQRWWTNLLISARPQRQTNGEGCRIFGDLDQLKSKDTTQKERKGNKQPWN